MAVTETTTSVKEITFRVDDLTLKGMLHLPDAVSHPPVVIGSHGLFSHARSEKQLQLAELLNAKGIAYFRFDHRGCGDSEGEFGEVTTFENRCKDMLAAVETLRAEGVMRDPRSVETSAGGRAGKGIGLFGSSLGAAVALATAGEVGARAVVAYAAPMRSSKIGEFVRERIETEAFRRHLDLERLRFDLTDRIKDLQRVLLIHGDSDRVIHPSESHRIYQHLGYPKGIVMLKGGGHQVDEGDNMAKFLRETVKWYLNHL